MLNSILQQGDLYLTEKSKEVTAEFIKSDECRKLKENMIDTQINYVFGVAISAIQIGIPKRVFLIYIRPNPERKNPGFGPTFYFNPEIIDYFEKTVRKYESCLSVKESNLYAEVERSDTVKFKYLDENGHEIIKKESGFMARIIQHEIDHLNGILFTERADKSTYMTTREYQDYLGKK